MKIEKSEKRQQSPGVEPRTPLACMSALPLSHNSQTTTNPHNPLYMYYTGGILNASVAHLAATQHVRSELS